jgi:hypothetical protein
MRFSLLTIQRDGKKVFLIHQIGEGAGGEGVQLAVGQSGKIALFDEIQSAKDFVERKAGTLEWDDFKVDLDEIRKWTQDSQQPPPTPGALRRAWFLIVLTGINREGFPDSIQEFIHSREKSSLVAILSDCLDWDKAVSLSPGDYEDLRVVFRDGLDYLNQVSQLQ